MRKSIICIIASWSFVLAAGANQRNVLFVAVDDMNDWVGCLGGYPGVETPNIDRLAERGTLFTNAHVAAPVCNASRTAVMTGLYPSTTGIYDNGRWWRPSLPGVKTIPEYFRAHGYLVLGGGKLHHHTPGNNPPDQWDSYFDQVFDDHFHRPPPGSAVEVKEVRWPEGFPLNGIAAVREGKRPPVNPREFDWGGMQGEDFDLGDGKVVEWAVEYLRDPSTGSGRGKPFFLGVGIFRPHLPWYYPNKYEDLYPLEEIRIPKAPADDLDDIPARGQEIAAARRMDFELIKNEGQYKKAVRAYLASISYADALVGKLLDAVEASGKAEDTVIVFWSDHGWHLGEKQAWMKRTLWEESTRVPFIVVAPGVTGDARCGRPVNLVDIYPTLIELCGLGGKERLDGKSLVPLLRDPEATWERPSLTTHMRGDHALRGERWRYIRYADGGEELYDHAVDPDEWNNVVGDPAHAGVIAKMRKWLPKDDARPPPNKNAYRFDLGSYTWERKGEVKGKR